MYNRYIGNTGKVYRIADDEPPNKDTEHLPADTIIEHVKSNKCRNDSPFPFTESPNELAGNLKNMIGGFLPKGMELGDLLLILVLLLLYLEKEDEEILIILSVLIFMGFK